MVDNISIAVHAYASRILMSFSVDETLPRRYVNLSSNFREPPFKEEMSPFLLKHIYCFVCIHMETNAICILLVLLRSHIHEYGHVRNRHVIFITIEYIKNRNLKNT